MSRLVLNRNGGSADEYGHLLALSRFMTGEVIEGMTVTQDSGSNMAVRVQAGSARIPTGTSPGQYAYFVAIDTAAPGEQVIITTANASNPRRDLIVAYVDKAVTPSTATPNNPNNMLKLVAVAGTPAASPVDPTGAAIQAAIGASNPYIILARVSVAAAVTQVTTANVADLRALAYQTPSNLPAGSVPFAAVASNWWEEIGRATLTTTADVMTVTGLPNRKYLQLVIYAVNSGSINARLRFNNDSGTNYSDRASVNGSADGTGGNGTSAGISAADTANPKYIKVDVINFQTREKFIMATTVEATSAGATFALARAESADKWANTTDVISRVDVINVGAGDFAAGSELVILGHN